VLVGRAIAKLMQWCCSGVFGEGHGFKFGCAYVVFKQLLKK
jgi:hypothetical protein